MRRGWAVGAIALLAAAGGRAAGDPPGAVPAGFRSFVVVDDRFPPKVAPPKKADDRDPRDRTAKMHDLVVEAGLNPAVVVFTRVAPADDAAAAKLAKALDPLVQKYRANNFAADVIFLTLDKEFPADDRRTPDGGFLREADAQKVQTLAASLKTTKVPFGLAARKSDATAAWGIGDGDETVVALIDTMKVLKRWAFPAGQPPTDDQLAEITAAAEKLASGK